MQLSDKELNAIWQRVVVDHYRNDPYVFVPLNRSQVSKIMFGCEVKIPVSSIKQEDYVTECIEEINSLLRQSDPELSSCRFFYAYSWDDGDVVSAEPVLFPVEPDIFSPFKKKHRNVRNISDIVSRAASNFSCNVSNLVELDPNPPADVKKSKNNFKRIRKEIDNVYEHGPSFSRADRLLSESKKPLDSIQSVLGSESKYFQHVYKLVIFSYLDLVLKAAKVNPSLSGIRNARKNIEYLDSLPITKRTKECVGRTGAVLLQLEQSPEYKQKAKEYESDSRLSERIKNFALDHSTIESGGKRYTSPGWALLALIVLSFGQWVAIFEKIGSLFKKKSDV